MAAKGTSSNGHSRLEEALTTLLQTQATLAGQLAASDRAQIEFQRRHLEYERENNARVDRLEAQMKEVVRILTEHTRQLERLTDAVRDRIGFKE